MSDSLAMRIKQLREQLHEKLMTLPEAPGVYMFKDVRGKVIYVGKASVLRNRVRSYFHIGAVRSPWQCKLLERLHDFEYITTRSEKEALILEGNLIKIYHPPFNIRFKDDKRYPFLKIPLDDPYPPLMIVRMPKDDNALYFGPYTSGKALHETLETIKHTFGMRIITMVGDRRASGCPWRDTSKQMPRACLEYHIMRCCGPCIGAVTHAEYQAIVREVRAFLEGHHEQVVEELRRQMFNAAEQLEFEKAARLRDRIFAIERIVERQSVVVGVREDIDAFGYAWRAGFACIQMLLVRSGRVVGNQPFFIRIEEGRSAADILGAFLKQHYSSLVPIPQMVLVPVAIEDADVMAQWLSDKRGSQVTVHMPMRGKLRELMEIAHQNAEQALLVELERTEREQEIIKEAIESLQQHLNLPHPPRRIECFDISNIHGHIAVGSMVVFQDGRPDKKSYRRFSIKAHEGVPNDYAMMREVLRRRFHRLLQGDEKFSQPPDLLLIDGGKGQLNCALQVLREMGLEHIPVVGLAKQHELIYVPYQHAPIALPYNAPALHLLQRIRDEAHRFAIKHHRSRRRRVAVHSILDEAPGIGEVRKRQLLTHFGSLDAIRKASVEELASVPSMTEAVARKLWEFLHQDDAESE